MIGGFWRWREDGERIDRVVARGIGMEGRVVR